MKTHKRKLDKSRKLVKIDSIISDYLIGKIDETESLRQIYFEIRENFESFFKMDLSYDKEQFIEILQDQLSKSDFKLLLESDILYLADRCSYKIDCTGMLEDLASGIWAISSDYVDKMKEECKKCKLVFNSETLVYCNNCNLNYCNKDSIYDEKFDSDWNYCIDCYKELTEKIGVEKSNE